MSKSAANLRGNLINQTAFIEKVMDFQIAGYFCNNDRSRDEMVDLMLGDRFISFESKRTVFEILVKRHSKNFYAKIGKEFFANMTTIQTHRNKLAHLMQDTTEEAHKEFKEKKRIGFIKFKEKTETIWYSDTDISDLDARLKMVYFTIPKIILSRPPSSPDVVDYPEK